MRFRIDQNVSYRVAKSLIAALPDRAGYDVSYVGDVHPPGTSDPDWLAQFAKEDGTAIISGDYRILSNWPDLVAYTESGLISFFPPPAFEHLDRFGKVAFLVRWWPAIIEKTKISKSGDRWRLPMKWQPAHIEMDILRDPRVKGRTVTGTSPPMHGSAVVPLLPSKRGRE